MSDRDFPALKILQWGIILLGLAWIGVSLVLVARGLEDARHERIAQQAEIAELQHAIARANDRLSDVGEPPEPVTVGPCSAPFTLTTQWILVRTQPNDTATQRWAEATLCLAP